LSGKPYFRIEGEKMGESKKENEKKVIAVAGKGGTGKTTLTAIMTKLFSQGGYRILAVDADPPISLAYTLGIKPIKTVGEMRAVMIEDPGEKRRIKDRPMAEVIRDELVIEEGGISLLVMGQPEAAGCFCGLNELMKFGIESLSKTYDITLIDCEAGIEQINRRTISALDILIMVSDPTQKGVRTAAHLKNIAEKYGVMGHYQSGLVFNRTQEELGDLETMATDHGLQVWGKVPLDEQVALFDRTGRPTVGLPDDAQSVLAVRNILLSLGFLIET
jgi:CO dehydrogenase maturation factor